MNTVCRRLALLASALMLPAQPAPTKVATARQLGPVGYRDPIGAQSPDGLWLAWAVHTHLYVRRMQGGAVTELGPTDNMRWNLAWLPDANHLAVREFKRGASVEWVVYDVPTGKRVPLWEDRTSIVGHLADTSATKDSLRVPVARLRELTWSPDGHSVAGVVNDGPRSQLWIIDAQGASARVITSSYTMSLPAWLPDSRRVACVVGTDAGPRASIPCGDAPRAQPALAVYGPLAFSPDGQVVYFASPNTRGTLDLWRRSMNDGSVKRLTNLPRDTYAPSVARDGRVLFKTQMYSTTIRLVASAGGRSRAATTFMSETPSWNWTGTQLGVTYGDWRRVVDDERYPDISQNVGIVNVDGKLPASAVTAVVAASPSEDQGMCWSPNGRWIVFHSHQQHTDDLWLEPADHSSPPRQVSQGGYETGWPRWSRDGRWIAFVTEKPDAGAMHARLYVIPVNQTTGETQPVQPVSPDGLAGDVEDAEWMPDGERIVFSTTGPGLGERAIYLVSRGGGAARRIHQFRSEHEYSGIGLSPDGASVAFIAPAPDGHFQVFTVPVSGGPARQITVDPADATQPAWSPDGKQIAFTRWEYRVDFLVMTPDR